MFLHQSTLNEEGNNLANFDIKYSKFANGVYP